MFLVAAANSAIITDERFVFAVSGEIIGNGLTLLVSFSTIGFRSTKTTCHLLQSNIAIVISCVKVFKLILNFYNIKTGTNVLAEEIILFWQWRNINKWRRNHHTVVL